MVNLLVRVLHQYLSIQFTTLTLHQETKYIRMTIQKEKLSFCLFVLINPRTAVQKWAASIKIWTARYQKLKKTQLNKMLCLISRRQGHTGRQWGGGEGA